MLTEQSGNGGAGRKPVLLIVTAGYLPGTKHGGISTSRQNLAFAMRDYFDVRIVTLNHDFRETKPYPGVHDGWNERPEGSVLYFADDECTVKHFSSVIDELRPVAVYASGTITSYFTFNRFVFKAAKKRGVPVVVTPDGDLCDEALAIKPFKKKAAIAFCRAVGAFNDVSFQITLPEEGRNLERYLGVIQNRVRFLPNLPFMLEPRVDYYKEPDALRCVLCARFSPQKGPDFAIEALSTAAKADSTLRLTLDIFGPMEDESLWDRCRVLIDEAPRNVSVKYCGVLLPEDAKTIFRDYDLMVLPTKSENYCYAVEESLLCGCPVLLSRGTTPWDDLDGVAGFTEPLSDPMRFAVRIGEVARMGDADYASFTNGVRRYVERKLDYEVLRRGYIDYFDCLSIGGN